MALLASILMWAVMAWIGFQVAVWVVSPLLFLGTRTACTNGLYIVIPKALRAELSQEELSAVRAHEWGHIRHGHPYRNLVASCLGRKRTPFAWQQQELQADDYAASRGHAHAFAAVLRRSENAFDLYRARRLSN